MVIAIRAVTAASPSIKSLQKMIRNQSGVFFLGRDRKSCIPAETNKKPVITRTIFLISPYSVVYSNVGRNMSHM